MKHISKFLKKPEKFFVDNRSLDRKILITIRRTIRRLANEYYGGDIPETVLDFIQVISKLHD